MMGQQSGWVSTRSGKLRLQHLGNALMVLLPRAPQQRLIGRVLDQGMLEAVGRLRRQPRWYSNSASTNWCNPRARCPRPMATPPGAAHRKTRAPAWPRVAPGPSPLPGDPGAPSASRAAWWESPAAARDRSGHSGRPAPGAARTPTPSWSALPQTGAPHRSWPPPAPRPRRAGPCRGPPGRSSPSPGAAASAAA